jgi:hypothetical protein
MRDNKSDRLASRKVRAEEQQSAIKAIQPTGTHRIKRENSKKPVDKDSKPKKGQMRGEHNMPARLFHFHLSDNKAESFALKCAELEQISGNLFIVPIDSSQRLKGVN